MKLWRLAALATVAVTTGSSCASPSPSSGQVSAPAANAAAPTPSVIAIAVSGVPISMIVGDAGQLTATAALSDKNTEDVTTQATWQSTAANVASVSGGKISATGAGAADVTASFDGESGTAHVIVNTPTTPAVPCSPVVSPTSIQFINATSGQFITVQAPASCTWSYSSNVPWLDIVQCATMTSSCSSSGSATGSSLVLVSFEIDHFTAGGGNVGIVTIGGQTVTVTFGAPESPGPSLIR